MIGNDVTVWVATTPIDMRKSFDALALVVVKFLRHDPRSGNLFVFRNKGGYLAMVLWWDQQGWTIFYKRLEHGVFSFPDDGTTAVAIDGRALLELLSGKPIRTK
jgi:transposase